MAAETRTRRRTIHTSSSPSRSLPATRTAEAVSRQSRRRANGLIRRASSSQRPVSSSTGSPGDFCAPAFHRQAWSRRPACDLIRRITRSGPAAISVVSSSGCADAHLALHLQTMKLVDPVAPLLLATQRHQAIDGRQVAWPVARGDNGATASRSARASFRSLAPHRSCRS